MSLWKVIVIVSACTLLLFIGLLLYAFYPSIKNVSDHPGLKPYINRPLTLKRDVCIYVMEEGQYRFEPLLMSTDNNYPYEKKLILPAGSKITIEKFKTYRQSTGEGFTELYGIGSSTTASGKPFRFEFEWGNVDRAVTLKSAPWQAESEKPVYFATN
jgi:hypothetical protein